MPFKRLLNRADYLLLSLIVIVLTWQSSYLQGKLNLFELGLYLPGIDAILHGQIPFRDFFYLRGPFELYVPAFLMKAAGEQVWILAAYFYAGTVLTLIAAAWLAKELISQRALVYTAAVILVARTFPRVVFTFWGGLRYAWGLLAIFCIIRFLKTRKMGWAFASGLITAIGFWTSIEIGISALAAVIGTGLILRGLGYFNESHVKAGIIFVIGFFMCIVCYGIYLYANGALHAYVQTVLTVTTQMNKVFLQTEKVPSNIFELFAAMFNPGDKNFRQMTPLWGYIVLAACLWYKHRRSKWDDIDKGVIALGLYGLMLYAGAFRNLWASQFEMALQPWKIIQFYLLGQALAWIPQRVKTNQRIIHGVLLAAIIISSAIYAGGRFKKKFFKAPLEGQAKVELVLPRTRGMIVPVEQAEDLVTINEFLTAHTNPGDAVLMYPEMGAVHFIVDRPAVGRFATATMAWLSPSWYNEWLVDVKDNLPRYAVTLKEPPAYFEKSSFPVEANRLHFNESMQFIRESYRVVAQTPLYYIYERNE